jgi:hypothetical protein
MKTKKRTTKKAITLLTRVETLLSDALDQCSAIEKSVEKNARVLLRSAEAAVTVAKDFFITPEPAKARRKAAKAPKRVPRHRAARPGVKPPAAAHRRAAPPKARKRVVRTAKPLAAPVAGPAVSGAAFSAL